jgi:predicted NACHT family NTPase
MFDALDEMTLKGRAEADQVITDIGRLAATPYRSPVLITCRRSFFQDSAQEDSLKDRGFQVYYLWPWSNDDIYLYLAKARDQGLFDLPPAEAFNQLSGIYDLRDLASRALLSAMLIDQWQEIIPNADVTQAPPDLVALYENHVEKALLNWQAHKTLSLQKHELVRYMEELAYFMFKLDSLDIRPEELDEYFEQIFGRASIGRYSDIAQSLVRDISANSLLVRSNGNSYSFCHVSVWEFFLARKFLGALRRQDWDALSIVGRGAQYASIVQNFLMPIIQRPDNKHLADAFFRAIQPSTPGGKNG